MSLETLVESIRKRPGMYIGEPEPHPLLWELVGNCVDVELAGRALTITVELHDDGSASVEDDGPGIALPLEPLMVDGHTTPTADGHAPHVHLGPISVGLVLVSALSERVEVRTRRGDAMVRQIFSRGTVVSPLEREADPPQFGTRIRFWPDREILDVRWNLGLIQRRLQELVALRSGLACRFVVPPQWFPSSLDVTCLMPSQLPTLPLHDEPIRCELTRDQVTARVALRWYPRFQWSRQQLRSFCNLVETREGMHLSGFAQGIGRTIVAAARERFGAAWRQAYDHVSPCLAAVVAVEILDPHWTSPTRDRPANPELAQVVCAAIVAELPGWFERNPEVLAKLLE